jgi:hypothetical protein
MPVNSHRRAESLARLSLGKISRDDLFGLLGNRRRHDGVGMAEVGCALTAHAVNVLATLIIPQQRALAAHNRHAALVVNTGCMLAFQSDCIRHIQPQS